MASPAKPATQPRTPLNRDRVLRAAVALADENGIGSLSMRKLGEALGVEAMSLYNHVANRGDLFDGMIDLVFGEIGLPSGGAGWKAAMRQRALSARQALSRHPWAIGLMESRSTPAPRRCGTMTPSSAASGKPVSRSPWPRTRSPSWTATSTASRCRRQACRSRPGTRPPAWRG